MVACLCVFLWAGGRAGAWVRLRSEPGPFPLRVARQFFWPDVYFNADAWALVGGAHLVKTITATLALFVICLFDVAVIHPGSARRPCNGQPGRPGCNTRDPSIRHMFVRPCLCMLVRVHAMCGHMRVVVRASVHSCARMAPPALDLTRQGITYGVCSYAGIKDENDDIPGVYACVPSDHSCAFGSCRCSVAVCAVQEIRPREYPFSTL